MAKVRWMAGVFGLLLAILGGSVVQAADYIWLEGEKPAVMPPQAVVEGSGRPMFLSGGQWLKVTADAGEVQQKIPADGVMLSYPFHAAAAGQREVWARIGYEFARAPFDWRIDGGDWKIAKPDDLTTDLMELSFFTEVAWLKLGDADIAAGDHTMELRLPRFKNAKGEFQRMLFALDAVCLSAGEFHPYSKFKPDENPRDAQDEAAAKNVFKLPEATSPEARSAVKLAGTWEVARFDEQLPTEVAAPIQEFPKNPVWKAIAVPGDKNVVPALVFAHRLWYRTRVDVPASMAGRSFYVVFPCNSLNTTVYANGIYCGFDKNPFARLQIDVTKGIRAGQVNELWVGIKDTWYGREADAHDPLKLRNTFNVPLGFFGQGFQRLVYPLWSRTRAGIVNTPEMVSAGPTYAADVFAKPSVARKELGMEITIANPMAQPVSGEVVAEAVNDKTGQVEMTALAQAFTLEAGKETVLDYAAKWENPKLWWPDEPHLYRLRTTVKIGGKPVDVKETLFGFREWSIDGSHFRLNGVNWQGFSEQAMPENTLDGWVRYVKDPHKNYGFIRLWMDAGDTGRFGADVEQILERADREGINIRRTGYLDGEAIGYMPEILKPLGENWCDHLRAWIKGERNHPSIMLWSVENEINFINARNMGQLDVWEPVLHKAWQVVQKVDPTRAIMTDGGGATRAQILPVHGDHYSTKPFWNYPQLAYEANSDQAPWTRDWKHPVYIGEELFAAGINPAYAYFGGEQVFLGKEGNRPAVGKAMQVISQGYRWFGVAACDFCQSQTDADGSQYNGWSPRAVLVRQWDWTFGSGQKAKRTFGIFNNTHFADPLTFTWALNVAGQAVDKASKEYQVAPGENVKFDTEITFPKVTERQEGELVLTLTAQGNEVFRDVKALTVLPDPATPNIGAGKLFVYDPKGSVTAYLKSTGTAFTEMQSLTPPQTPAAVWLVGRDALKAEESSTNVFAAYAAGGGRVILLEQENPLRFQGLNPGEAEAARNIGRTAFVEDAVHPILHNLKDKDFFTWEPGEVVYRNAYLKPSRGAKSIIQCNESLTNSALMVIPVGPGVMVLNQTVLTDKLADNITARTLLFNMIGFAGTYQLEQVATAASVDPKLAGVLESIGLQFTRAATPLEAMANAKVALISATPANLKLLGDNLAQVKAFAESGGRIILHGLTPEGLEDYNKLVGYDHMIRPFRREKVCMSSPRNPLLSGVGLSDVALYSSKAIFNFQAGDYVASDTFSYVVDLEDVAPFAKLGNGFHYNLVTGMCSADGWPYIVNEPAEKSVYTFTFPKPQTLTSWSWWGNVNYDRTSRVSLTFDNDEAGKMLFDVPEKSEPVTLDIAPGKTATSVTVRHAVHTDLPDKKQGGTMILGCDNIRFFAQRPADFHQKVRPMLNIGTMVEYPQGKGGIILCNLLFKDQEEHPINGLKKRNVLSALLHNLKAPFAGKTVIAGANLEYTPIDLSKQANQFRTERGWFGDKNFTFKDIPTGEQRFAGVKFNVYEFATSPVPTAVMLGGPGVPNGLAAQVTGIPVNRKADALFFLQAARVDKPRDQQERTANALCEMAKYIVHYADGKTVEIPLYLEVDLDNYRQKSPQPLSGAQIAWSHAYEGGNESAVAYMKQWNNPHPEDQIASIDLVYGKDRRGVPALLALSAADSR